MGRNVKAAKKASSETAAPAAPKTHTRGDGYTVQLESCYQVYDRPRKTWTLFEDGGGHVDDAKTRWEGVREKPAA